MLVSESAQVTRRKFSQREAKQPPPAMFTRSQAVTNTAPATTTAAKSVTSSLPLTTASVITGAGGTTTHTSACSSDVVPSVSLTITAVAASLPEREGVIATTLATPVLDTPTITNFVLNSLEGVHSGVPTRTTPTLTPTTLRNIEQTFLELSSVQPPETHTNQAGFVPPLVQPTAGSTFVSVDSKCWGGGTLTQIPHTSSSTSSGGVHLRAPVAHAATSTATTLTMPSQIQQQQPPRRTGGRRPIKDEKWPGGCGLRGAEWWPGPGRGGGRPVSPEVGTLTCYTTSDESVAPADVTYVSDSHVTDDTRISAEEEERRTMRRERNKLAAARCRKRRLDQTNMLQDETDDLEDKKNELQTEIQVLQQQRDELEFLLATHKAVCRRRVHASAASIVSTTTPLSTAAPVSTVTTNATTQVRLHKKPVVVKEEPMDDDLLKTTISEDSRPRRPTSLNVAPVALRTPSVADLGVPIETPSAGLRGLNFDSMMEGGTGLTPVTSGTGLTPLHTGLTPLTTPVVSAPTGSASSNCGTQQRSSSSDLSSPDSVPPKLVSL